MAGVYGPIDSRNDFFALLHEALRASEVLASNPVVPSIRAQLQAIEGWTAGGREPSEEERESLDMSLRAERELGDTDDPDVETFTANISALHNYVEDWPSDDEAANATDDDFFEDEDD